jgi:hypothetical protein
LSFRTTDVRVLFLFYFSKKTITILFWRHCPRRCDQLSMAFGVESVVYLFCVANSAAMLFLSVYTVSHVIIQWYLMTVNIQCLTRQVKPCNSWRTCHAIQIITLSDVDCDHLNASECSKKLNKVSDSALIRSCNVDNRFLISPFLSILTWMIQWIVPEILSSASLTVLHVVTYHWKILIFHLPVTLWLSYRLYSVPHGNIGVYDPLELRYPFGLRKHMKASVFRNVFYICSFLLYLYCMTISVISRRAA